MSKVIIAGAGAFGTAMTLAIDGHVTLTGRDLSEQLRSRVSPRLPGVVLPDRITIDPGPKIGADDVLLLAIPMQAMGGYLKTLEETPKVAIACCKGIELRTGRGPSHVISDMLDCPAAVLTGPSFATDIARNKPTALTLACADAKLGAILQERLSSDTLRLYLSQDTTGAELAGALKNVIAIACGICIGAGLGESARAALMTRGMAETNRLAIKLGAQAETLNGLAGFGDLALTCTSAQSRNYSFGLALGAGQAPAGNKTVEGRATSQATLQLARKHGIDMPITEVVAGMVTGELTLPDALKALMRRPLTTE